MNKAKQKESGGFLKWLERQLSAKLDDLSGKTTLRAYDDEGLDRVLDVLTKNRKKIKVDPTARRFQEALERELDKSVQELGPLKARLQATDELIEEIVYRLYGLTAEERTLVKGETPALASVGKKSPATDVSRILYACYVASRENRRASGMGRTPQAQFVAPGAWVAARFCCAPGSSPGEQLP